jgi:hypothetical protein
MPLPFDLLPIEGGRIKVRIRLQEAQDVIDADLIGKVKDDPRWRGVMYRLNGAGDGDGEL